MKRNYLVVITLILFCKAISGQEMNAPYINHIAYNEDSVSSIYNDKIFDKEAPLTAFDAFEYSDATGKTPYRLHSPTSYSSSKKYPLILFLHGAGKRGSTNIDQIKMMGARIWLLKEFYDKDPAFILAPQCAEGRRWSNMCNDDNEVLPSTPLASDDCWKVGSHWQVDESAELKRVMKIIEKLRAEFSIDTDRIYVTGQSMGGYGSWDVITRHSDMFAAALPVCGGGDPSKAPSIVNRGIWAFHGDKDGTVPYKATLEMCAAIDKNGGKNVKATIFQGVGHSSWDAAYSTSEAIRWLLTQRKGKTPAVAIKEFYPVQRIRPQTKYDTFLDLHGRKVTTQSHIQFTITPGGVKHLKKKY